MHVVILFESVVKFGNNIHFHNFKLKSTCMFKVINFNCKATKILYFYFKLNIYKLWTQI